MIEITRIYEAPREAVWRAWTRPEELVRWWGKRGWTAQPDTVVMDVRPGGTWRATMFCAPGAHEIRWTGEYLEVSAPERLVFSVSNHSTAGRPELVTVVLTDLGDGSTDVTYRLALDVSIPLIGMLKRKGEKILIDAALKGLKKRVESLA